MEETESEKYLGDIITSNAKNLSIDICQKVMSSLNDIWLGKYHFEAASTTSKKLPSAPLLMIDGVCY